MEGWVDQSVVIRCIQCLCTLCMYVNSLWPQSGKVCYMNKQKIVLTFFYSKLVKRRRDKQRKHIFISRNIVYEYKIGFSPFQFFTSHTNAVFNSSYTVCTCERLHSYSSIVSGQKLYSPSEAFPASSMLENCSVLSLYWYQKEGF